MGPLRPSDGAGSGGFEARGWLIKDRICGGLAAIASALAGSVLKTPLDEILGLLRFSIEKCRPRLVYTTHQRRRRKRYMYK